MCLSTRVRGQRFFYELKLIHFSESHKVTLFFKGKQCFLEREVCGRLRKAIPGELNNTACAHCLMIFSPFNAVTGPPGGLPHTYRQRTNGCVSALINRLQVLVKESWVELCVPKKSRICVWAKKKKESRSNNLWTDCHVSDCAEGTHSGSETCFKELQQ